MRMPKRPAAGLPADFLRKSWQKRFLLVRQALPQYCRLLTRETLFGIAARDDVQARLVTCSHGRWRLEHGPFTRGRLARLPGRAWTLLVQGVNHVLPAAQDLLLEFAFIPYARLDDVMVSYAPPGGGVGPHFDSYDVFLVQLAGNRRWQVSRQRDLSLVEGAPLKLLRRFRAGREWLLTPGDMLYLPPNVAHDGIATSECITASIGFRAPSARELGVRFLEYLQDELEIDGMYSDPDLRPQMRPALIGDDMVRKVRRMLDRIEWGSAEVADFLGRYLTEPKPHVLFARPMRPLALAPFARALRRRGACLAPATLMLFRGSTVFINGERCAVGRTAAATLMRLADRRRLAAPPAFGPEPVRWLYQWYRAGYIYLNDE
jgi:50S ribosomal protein L16 3-hydroxylase